VWFWDTVGQNAKYNWTRYEDNSWTRIDPKLTHEYKTYIGFEQYFDEHYAKLDKNYCGAWRREGGEPHVQSPIDIVPTPNATCNEFHEIRERPGDFRMNDTEVLKEILPTKLRLNYPLRTGEEPDPPNVDIPQGWQKQMDINHIDVKFPSEHTINGTRYFGEYQVYVVSTKTQKGVGVISILIDVHRKNRDNIHFQKFIDEFQKVFDEDKAACEKKMAMYPSSQPSTSSMPTETSFPSAKPSISEAPSTSPSFAPSFSPTVAPSFSPSDAPSFSPSDAPSSSSSPSAAPSDAPSVSPSSSPSVTSSATPTVSGSSLPSAAPSDAPSVSPSSSPSVTSSATPTVSGSSLPSAAPSDAPSVSHSSLPSAAPSVALSDAPSVHGSFWPSVKSSVPPTHSPSSSPSIASSTAPSVHGSSSPSVTSSAAPSVHGSSSPSVTSSAAPSVHGSSSPSVTSSAAPSVHGSSSPSVTTPLSGNSLSSVISFLAHSVSGSSSPPVTSSTAPSISQTTAQSKGNTRGRNRRLLEPNQTDGNNASLKLNQTEGRNHTFPFLQPVPTISPKPTISPQPTQLPTKPPVEKDPFTSPGQWDPLDPKKIMRSHYFYGYKGSLTEPPCTPFAHWYIIDEPMLLSTRQIEQLKSILFDHVDKDCNPTSADYNGSVARPIQQSVSAKIWQCTCHDFLSDMEKRLTGRRVCLADGSLPPPKIKKLSD